MTSRQARFVFGPLLLLAVIGMFVADDAIGAPFLTVGVVVLLAVGALIEYPRMLGERLPREVGRLLAPTGALFLLFLFFPWDPWRWVLVGWVVISPFACLMGLRWRKGVSGEDLGAMGAITVAWLFIVFPCAALLGMLHLPSGLLWTAIVIVGSKLNDIGGYLIGSSFGRHKLCPGISPNKSVEGAVGGLLLGAGGTFAMITLLELDQDALEAWEIVLFGLGLGLATQFGDLFESMLKRAAGVKDSGALIPAFGGVMDLIDSLIFAAPLGYAVGLAWLG